MLFLAVFGIFRLNTGSTRGTNQIPRFPCFVLYTSLAKMSFDEIFDLTAGVAF